MFELFTESLLKILGFYPSRHILKIQAYHVIQGLIILISNEVKFFLKRMRNNKPTIFDIYIIIDRFHKELFIAIQIYFFYRIYRYSTQRFYENLSKYFIWRFDSKSQKRLHQRLIIIICVRFIKFVLYFKRAMLNSLITLSAEISLATSDFIFCLFIENLYKRLEILKYQVVNKINPRKFHKKLINHVEIERKIFKRFSVELFITITYNYFQLIDCSYWIFVRITHKRLRDPVGENFIIININLTRHNIYYYRMGHIFISDSTITMSCNGFFNRAKIPSESCRSRGIILSIQ